MKERSRKDKPVALASMTGFSRADGRQDDYHWIWEIRSVNGRNLDMRCRVPSGYEAIEAEARKRAQDRFRRGSLSATLQVSRSSAGAAFQINHDLLHQLAPIFAEAQRIIPTATAPRLDGVIGLRGIIDIVEPEESEALKAARDQAILTTLETAFDGLSDTRAEEGSRLSDILRDQLEQMTNLVAQAKQAATGQPQAIKDRLTAIVADLTDGAAPGLDERIAQEITVLATKADVQEELDRLDGHIAAAGQLIGEGGKDGAAGRRLDFLAQEFNREANTLCSKSQDSTLTAVGLELKITIDRIREQAQNVE